jgi:hypothetical protein
MKLWVPMAQLGHKKQWVMMAQFGYKKQAAMAQPCLSKNAFPKTLVKKTQAET